MMLLVTGATGDVGKAVLAELADKPVAVRVLACSESRAAQGSVPVTAPAAANIEVVHADLKDEGSLKRALQGVEAAFLESAFSPKMAEVHAKLIAAAKDAGVSRIVQLSGVGADSGMCCARALRWLGQIESSSRSSGLAVTHLRPTFFMQNLLQFSTTVGQQNVIAGPFRANKWTFVDARDVGAVAAVTLMDSNHAGRTYTITGSEALTYVEIAERLSRVLGRPTRYVDITANEARGRLQAAGAPPVMIEATLELWDVCASNLINVEPTPTVKEVTGREPRSFEQFAQDYREQFLAA